MPPEPGIIFIYMKEQVTPLNSFMGCCARQGMAVITN
jgi:hypothetical protein